jgi:hypothetical protein
MSRIQLLRFPAPYRAALALSNDPDDLWDPRGWWEFLRFLNTREITASGPGLGLEAGDAFWFWSDHGDEQPGSYFEGLTEKPSAFAPLIGALGRSGYLDTLHSYGNFSRHGGFRRNHAERAAAVLGDEGFAPRVWVNHGGAHDFQNLWTGCGDVPENPEARGAPAPEYHLDITRKLGLRYAWIGDLTGTPGQGRSLGPRDWLHAASPVRRDAMGHLARGLARRLAYRNILAAYPNYSTLRNPLFTTRTFRDNTVARTFARYGNFGRATFADLGWLLRPYFLDALEAGGGLSVVFVHWSRHPGRAFRDLPGPGLEGLRRLAERAHDGRIWVTTTGRLLAYWEARQALRVHEAGESGEVVVTLDADRLPDGRELAVEDLAGITLRVPDPRRVRVLWKGTPLAVEPSPGGTDTVWVPWKSLVFPEPPKEFRR